MKPIKTKYVKKMVDGKNFGVVTVTGKANEPKRLTREEFNEGKAGLVYLDSKTGKVIFDD